MVRGEHTSSDHSCISYFCMLLTLTGHYTSSAIIFLIQSRTNSKYSHKIEIGLTVLGTSLVMSFVIYAWTFSLEVAIQGALGTFVALLQLVSMLKR